MLFNSFEFLIFFSLVTTLYFILPNRFRWFMILVASCLFYMNFIPIYITILGLTILVDYFAGIKIEQTQGAIKKGWLIFSIITTCAILFVFKYYNFFITNYNDLLGLLHIDNKIDKLNIILPIGLSFHTFQSLSYVIEVYRGNQKAEKNFGIYSLYVMFYPQLVAGPIERPQNLLYQFHSEHKFNYDDAKKGLILMAWGLFKKSVIADRVSLYVDFIYNDPTHHHGAPIWLATYLFAIQIYCDFSGYSDMAIGAARIMGYKLMTNFNRPYFSKSIDEFWKRWHISLSTWFKDYVYIPLGGNRVIKWRWYYNLLITFLLSGFWHGASWTYVIWGGLNGLYLVMAIQFKPFREWLTKTFGLSKSIFINKIVNIAITFNLICFTWVFFRAKTIQDAKIILKGAIQFSKDEGSKIFQHSFDAKYFAFISVFLLLMTVIEWNLRNGTDFPTKVSQLKNTYRWALYLGMIIVIMIFGNFGSREFIYFQF